MSKPIIDTEVVKKIAGLSMLELSSQEIDKFATDLQNILNYLSKIQEVDVSGIENLHHLQPINLEDFREDLATNTDSISGKIIQNVHPSRVENGYIRVKNKNTSSED